MLRVLFVCTGNICRSPMAHGFLADRSDRLYGGAIRVRSAGMWARPGSPPTYEAVGAAADRGVDIAGLRTTPFSRDLAEWADVVVAMTADQREEILERVPDAAHKTFTLKELVALLDSLPPPAGALSRASLLERVGAADALRATAGASALADEDVADPLGLSMETFRAVAWEIETLIQQLAPGLAGAAERAPIREA